MMLTQYCISLLVVGGVFNSSQSKIPIVCSDISYSPLTPSQTPSFGTTPVNCQSIYSGDLTQHLPAVKL